MFQWDWDSIASECSTFIGPAGYGYVQGPYTQRLLVKLTNLNIFITVSPPQEHIAGTQWWTDYQPVSYILTSKRGTREQYENMIHTCHAAGVGVIAGAS